MIHNPILPGFNPDPSIIRVGSDYYIATSTFEWFPGVQIYHSTDLVNWTPLTDIVVDGATATFTDPTPYNSPALRFYRIRQLPQ